jgi:2,3-diaminopropionate biosynthesis protein SbnA
MTQVPIVAAPHELVDLDVYVELERIFARAMFLRCEGFNFGGSIKLRAAAAMVADAERAGVLRPGSRLIESSSGNLGVALAVIGASKGLSFTCVTDARCNQSTVDVMRALGAVVMVVSAPEPSCGFFQARVDRVRQMCDADPRFVWLNQYRNEANWRAHYNITAPGIAARFPDLDVVFCGTGSGGTVMGCARYFHDAGRRTRVVAVDAVGSANFGHPAAPRLIPGVGAGVAAPLVDGDLVDDVVRVAEIDTIGMCRALAARGLLLGGSTGTACAGAVDWLSRHDPDRALKSVVIGADFGERYVNTVYNDEWVVRHFGAAALARLNSGGNGAPRPRARLG